MDQKRGYIPKRMELREIEAAFNALYRILGSTTGDMVFNVTVTPPEEHTPGTLYWDSDEGTLALMTDVDGVITYLGRDIMFRVVNKTGVALNHGDVVYISGAQGNRPTIALADADLATAHDTIGVVDAGNNGTIENNAEGYVIVSGAIRQGIDTSSFTAGDKLYLSTTPGELTNVAPTWPDHVIEIAVAKNSTANGAIQIHIGEHYKLDDLTGVNISGLSTGDHLSWDGSEWVNGELTAGELIVERLTGSALVDVQDVINSLDGTGLISGGSITDDGDSTITVGGGNGTIRATNSDYGTLYLFTWSSEAGANVALTDNALNYIYVEYNSGNPQVIATTSKRTDYNTNILLGTVYRSGATLYISESTHIDIASGPSRIIRRLDAVRPFEWQSGAFLSETGTLNIAVSAGTFWEGVDQFTTAAFDSSGSDTFTRHYNNGSWVTTSGVTTIDNTQYNNFGTGLATLTANRYGVHWVYLGVDGSVHVVYGVGDYVLADAEEAEAPSSLPGMFGGGFARLIGKIIIQKSATSFYEIASVFSTNLLGQLTGASAETDPVVGAISGIVKANGAGTISAAVVDEDYQGVIKDRFLQVGDRKAPNTAGGTFTSGAWQTRDLNTVVWNQFTSPYTNIVHELPFDNVVSGLLGATATVIGQTSGAVARVLKGGNPVASPLIVSMESGTFQDNEQLLASSGPFDALVNNPTPEDTSTGCDYHNAICLEEGYWWLRAKAVGYDCGEHKTRLRRTTPSPYTAGLGTNVRTNTVGQEAMESTLEAYFSATQTINIYELQHRCSSTQATNGFGLPTNWGENEVYVEIFAIRLGDL